jgi:hypothetical protein
VPKILEVFNVEYVLLVMIWEVSLVLAALGGFLYKNKKRPTPQEKPTTDEEKRAFCRMQKEQDNFMTYDGTPQEAINDYDYE